MAEQIRLSLVLSASFHFIIEDHMMGKQRQTLTMPYLYLHTTETSSCAFNFTETRECNSITCKNFILYVHTMDSLEFLHRLVPRRSQD